jgi:hypothetical protein
VKEIQIVMAIATYFEIHTKKTNKSSALYDDALKYYGQNCKGFVSTSERTDFGKHMLKLGLKCTVDQLNRTTSSPTSKTFTGKQIWVKGRDARKQILNVIAPEYNSFLQSGGIFPSGWEIEDMLEATRRKLYLDSKTTTINLTDVSDDSMASEVAQEDVEDVDADEVSVTDDNREEEKISHEKIDKIDTNTAKKKNLVPKGLEGCRSSSTLGHIMLESLSLVWCSNRVSE